MIDSVRLQVARVSRDIIDIAQEVKIVVQTIHRQVDRVEDGIEPVRDRVVRVKEFQLERTGPQRTRASTRAP